MSSKSDVIIHLLSKDFSRTWISQGPSKSPGRTYWYSPLLASKRNGEAIAQPVSSCGFSGALYAHTKYRTSDLLDVIPALYEMSYPVGGSHEKITLTVCCLLCKVLVCDDV